MTAWVFHRGALGDSVLLWPRLRVLRAQGPVVLVTGGEVGRLASRELGVDAVDVEQARFSALWRAGAAVQPVAGVAAVLDYAGSESAPWRENLAAMFPGATIRPMPLPRGGIELERFVREHPGCLGSRAGTPAGPVVLHIGAGSQTKRWPLESWIRLAGLVGGAALIAGEVEEERLSAPERAAFRAAGGRFIPSLLDLADTIKGGSVFVGADSGPTHLAAQLGVPTVALFGPTDPVEWAPVGARVRVVSPPAPRPMTWLGVERAVEAVEGVRL